MFRCHILLEGDRRDIAKYGMQPGAVVEADDVIDHVFSCFCLIGVRALPDPLHLEIEKEAFCYSVIPAICPATHAADKAVLGQ